MPWPPKDNSRSRVMDMDPGMAWLDAFATRELKQINHI